MEQTANILPDVVLVKGSIARLPFTFTGEGTAADPASLVVQIRASDTDALQEFRWLGAGNAENSPEITRNGAGDFMLAFTCRDQGHHLVTLAAESVDEPAFEGYFHVFYSSPYYKGVISDDDLRAELGHPSSDPDSDNYLPMRGPGSAVSIKLRRLEQFESEIERYLNDPKVAPNVNFAQLTTAQTLLVRKSYITPGLAGAALPKACIRYIYRARHTDGTQLEYDADIDRLVGRTVPGVKQYGCRLSGSDVEVLPNEDAGVVLYLLTREDAVAGVMPHVIGEINAEIVKTGRQAIEQFRRLRNISRQQDVETQKR